MNKEIQVWNIGGVCYIKYSWQYEVLGQCNIITIIYNFLLCYEFEHSGSGGSKKTTLLWSCCSPTHFQKYINIFGNVHVYDMYKEWNWEINILYLYYFVVDNWSRIYFITESKPVTTTATTPTATSTNQRTSSHGYASHVTTQSSSLPPYSPGGIITSPNHSERVANYMSSTSSYSPDVIKTQITTKPLPSVASSFQHNDVIPAQLTGSLSSYGYYTEPYSRSRDDMLALKVENALSAMSKGVHWYFT